MKKFKVKDKKTYNYKYSTDFFRLVKDLKKSLISKDVFYMFLNHTFPNIKIELYNIKDKIYYLFCSGHNNWGLPLNLEVSHNVIVCDGSSSLVLTKAVLKRINSFLQDSINI